MPKRMLAEHSEPGYFIELSDSFEYTLRHLTWDRVNSLAKEVLDFCAGLSPESGRALSKFHIEAPGEVGCLPPCLSALEPVEEELVKEAIEKANKEKGLSLRLYRASSTNSLT